MVSISMSAVLLAAIVLFASLSIVALGGLALKTMLDNTKHSDNYVLHTSVKKTFITSLMIVLLLVYYYLSTTG